MPQLSRNIEGRLYLVQYNRHVLPGGTSYIGRLSDGNNSWTFVYTRGHNNTRSITPAAIPAYIRQAIMQSIDLDDQ